MGGAGLAFIGTYLFAMPAIIACSFSFCQDAPLAVYRKSPVLFLFVRMRRWPYIVKAKKLILLRTLFGMTAMFCFFYSLTLNL
jgi:hypothetical protein